MVDVSKQKLQVESERDPEETPTTEKQQLHALFREYVQPILIGGGIVLALLLTHGMYKNYRQSASLRASQMLLNARSPEQLQQIIHQYPSTPSAPMAMLALAAAYFHLGQYDLAQATYTQFQQKFPKHPMAAAADIGKAQCLEASGQIDQAFAAFDAFASTNSGHFLSVLAIFGKGRCLTQLGRYAEAKTVYEDYMVANPNSGWLPLADSATLFADRELRAQRKKRDSSAINPTNREVLETGSNLLRPSPTFPSKATSAR
jgi:tetratricopeptide (TPR) repeat protein